MSDIESEKPDRSRSGDWPDYAAVWRWHFYAGVFCIPFVIVLSITGTIYLFRPQIETWQERDYDRLAISSSAPKLLSEQIVSAVTSVPEGKFLAVERPAIASSSEQFTSATRVLVDQRGQPIRVYVDPRDGKVMASIAENDRFIRVVRRIHGELLLGKRGSYLVEIAASWTIVMIVTGLVLWLPKRFRTAGVLYPRLNRQGKVFWKDLHSVGGFWASGLIVFLIATGLPWSLFWGDYFKSIRMWTGTTQTAEHWDNGSSNDEHANHVMADKPSVSTQRGLKGQTPFSTEAKKLKSTGPSWRKSAPDPSTYDLSLVNHLAKYSESLDFLPPVLLSPPSDASTVWTVKSDTANRPYQQTIHYDVSKQHVVDHETFADRHWVDQVVGQGIALHEGQRFGFVNQLIALLATVTLVMLSCSGIVLWWRRRDSMGLSPPAMVVAQSTASERLSRPRVVLMASMVFLLATYLPLFGLSLVVVLILDWLIFSRVEPLSIWLGRRFRLPISAIMLTALLMVSGCSGSPEPISGGTKGTLSSGGVLLSEMQVNVFDSTNQLVGHGYLTSDGSFELINQEQSGPLTLPNGTYRFTVESVGAEVEIPKEFTDAATTPIVVEHLSGSDLVLEMPRMKGI